MSRTASAECYGPVSRRQQKGGRMHPTRVEGLLVERVESEHLVYRSDADDAAALNEAAAAVFDLCDGTRDVDEIVAGARERGIELGRDEALLALHELEEAHLIVAAPTETGPSRRDLLIRLGAGTIAAAAIPVVELIAGPSKGAEIVAPGASLRPAQGVEAVVASEPGVVTIVVGPALVAEPNVTG